MKYKNKTKLPKGVDFERIETVTSEVVNVDTVKTHIIEWSDLQKDRNVESVIIKQYSDNWQTELNPPILSFQSNILSDDSVGVFQLTDDNRGVAISYKPYTTGEEYSIWFIVSITIAGETVPFDVAFYSYIKGGDTNGHGDLNKPALPNYDDYI
jgi:hypothetical protein